MGVLGKNGGIPRGILKGCFRGKVVHGGRSAHIGRRCSGSGRGVKERFFSEYRGRCSQAYGE